ncbi:MAG: hypothetical protein NVSMB33_13210 [Ktedonobacteraceae bacterium]
MHRYRLLVFFILGVTILFSSCEQQASSSPTDLVPVACHRELEVGMLFVTIENHGHDAGLSTMIVTYHTHSLDRPYVQLAVQTPAIPSGAERLITVDLPTVAHTGSFLQPLGKITIIVDARRVLPETNRANNILVTICNDLT